MSHEDAKKLLDKTEPAIREDSQFRELLIAEHEHVAESYIRNEEDGERRVTFFMTFAAGAAAVLGFLLEGEAGSLGSDSIHPLVVVTLGVIFAIGLFTLRRVVTRNAASDRYKRGLHRIRRYFLADADDPRLPFLPFNPFEPVDRPGPSWRSMGRGGWMETVAFVESIVAGALVGAIVPTPTWWWDVAVGGVAVLPAWMMLLRWAEGITNREAR